MTEVRIPTWCQQFFVFTDVLPWTGRTEALSVQSRVVHRALSERGLQQLDEHDRPEIRGREGTTVPDDRSRTSHATRFTGGVGTYH